MYDIHPQDVSFVIFAAFSGPNRAGYMKMMMLLEEMTEDGYQEAVSYDRFTEEVVAGEFLGEDTDAEKAASGIRKLVSAKLIRKHAVYNEEIKGWEESILLTGYGKKFLGFVRDISRLDLDDTKDYKITNARRNIRDLLRTDEIEYDRSDLLKDAYASLSELIYHLSGFSAEFMDFVAKESRNHIRNAREAGAWIESIMGSKFMIEFYTISDDSLGYISQIGEISVNVEKIRQSDVLTGLIVRDRKKKARELLAKQDISDINDREIEAQVSAQLRRISSIAGIEYREYISRILKTVNTVIKRTYLMFSAFGTDIGGDNILSRTMQLIRYVDKTGDESPLEDIINLYRLRYYTEESLSRPVRRTEERTEYPDPIYLFDTTIDQSAPIRTRRMESKEQIERVMEGAERIRLDSLPCGNSDEFCMLIRLVYIASSHESRTKKYGTEYIKGEPATCRKGPYTIPNIYIVRCRQEGGKKVG